MTIYQYLDLSTGHLPVSDREKLDNGHSPVTCRGNEYGWWLHVPSDEDEFADAIERNRTDFDEEDRLSEHFFNVLRFARAQGCDWILCDADADQEEWLPWFDDGEDPRDLRLEGEEPI